MPAPAPAGSIPVLRAGRRYRPLPAKRTIELAAPPPHEDGPEPGQTPALLVALLSAGSGAGFAVLSGDLRYLFVCLALALASLGTGRLTTRTARRARERIRAHRADAYLAHVDRAGAHARVSAQHQRDALESRHPSVTRSCAALTGQLDRESPIRLWQHRPEHADFGSVRLGSGPVAARVTVAAPPSEQPFDPGAEPLRAAAQVTADATSTVRGCPVLLDLRGLRCVAVMGTAPLVRAHVRAWLVQLATTHSPTDLLVILPRPAQARADADAQPDWGWAGWLPQTRTPPALGGDQRDLSRAARTVAVAADAVGPLLRAWHAWAVVVVDGSGRDGSVALPGRAARAGDPSTTYVVTISTDDELPAGYDAVVRLEPDGTCTVVRAGPDGEVVTGIVPESLTEAAARRAALTLAPMVVCGADDDNGPAPTARPVPLSELLAASAHLPPLVVPLGRGADDSQLDLDLREAADGGDGPHGVLVGATGSGKSELLRSLVLGLATSSGPEDLALVLVDFKGGATFDPVATLPHVAGLVTNLAADLAGIDRFQRSLEGELDERQQLLRAAGCESVRSYRRTLAASGTRRHAQAPAPDLLVVVDEFGELLEVQPDLLDTFVRIGRLGRSLGVHLLLSSQRLDEGRLRGLESHLGYRIALRTYTAAESTAVLGTPAAYELPRTPGLGLLRTSAGIRAFRAATASNPLPARTGPTREVVRLMAPWTPAPPTTPAAPAAVTADGLGALVHRIRASTAERARPVCLPDLPERLPLAHLMRSDPGPGTVVGLVDRPASRRQEVLRLDLVDGGHLAVVGTLRSGRSTFLRTLATALAADRDASALRLYALDLGDSLAGLSTLPQTAAVAAGRDRRALLAVLDELAAVADERTDESGTGDEPALLHLLLVDDVGRLRREHPDAEESLVGLAAAGRSAGLRLALTAARWSDLRPPLLDAVATRLELHLDEPADSRWPRAHATTIPVGPGGGLSPDGAPLRLAVADGTEPVARHPAGLRAPAVVPLPSRIVEDDIGATIRPTDDQDAFVLGVRERRSAPVLIRLLRPGAHLLLIGDRGSGRTTQLLRAAHRLAAGHRVDRIRLHVVDPRRSLAVLADLPHVEAHAYDQRSLESLVTGLAAVLQRRRPPAGLSMRELAARSWWDGPEHVLVVDDQDLLPGADQAGFALASGPAPGLAALAGFLPHAADLGWHVLLARPVTGLARAAYDPFLTRLRECATATLVLSGDRAEGPVAGGVGAVAMPPGRGRLLLASGGPAGGELVQCALPAGAVPP